MRCYAIIRACFFSILLPFLSTTAAPAQEQRPLWQVEFIDLTIELDPAQGRVKGDAWLRLTNPGSGGEDLEMGKAADGKFATLHMLASSKGFFIYAMLRELIGRDAFRQGLRGALQRFAWKTMTLEELRAQFEKAGVCDLKWFFDQWFSRQGAPEFAMNCTFENRSKNWLARGMITQLRDTYRVKAEIGFNKGTFCDIRTVEINARETNFSFLLSFKPQSVHFDPHYKILRWSEQF